ncbi:uncharacterized protein LOC100874761 isoform X2 [Megachile rotundata]|uniref:uncharacterized protein LOC100874761 isoform X2 n=1 Tax=Megachile rotundata TaxID=143995 RepID=UPI000614C995|nr:PREDICTED: uncharacterized protein LOC100874761 isoform X2 [Megachile rotundata]
MDKDVRRKCGKVRRALFHLLLIVGGATGLKDLTINVPAVVRSGDTVTLSCHYDLEGVPLYTIQWFLEEKEFYRYVPEREPPYSIYPVDGIYVNVSKSNTNDVTLVDVSRKLTGTYKCEVSAGDPSFHTMIERARMEVVDAPKTDPTIDIEKDRIAVGEMLRANCTTGNSRPASAITWKLNGDLIANDSMVYRPRYYAIPQDDDSKVSKSSIDFKVTNDMFRNGRLHLRCTASIADVYRKSADIEISEDAPRIASITGESPPRGHRSNSSSGLHSTWTTQTMMFVTTILLVVFSSMTSTATIIEPTSASR